MMQVRIDFFLRQTELNLNALDQNSYRKLILIVWNVIQCPPQQQDNIFSNSRQLLETSSL